MAAAFVLAKVAWLGQPLSAYQRLLPLAMLLVFAGVIMGWVWNLRSTRRLVEEAARRAGLQPH
jgi:hypothetical protein